MKLKNFISTSLQEIIQGVKEAQANANGRGKIDEANRKVIDAITGYYPVRTLL